MDRTVSQDDITRVLAEMDRKKKKESDDADTMAASESVSAIGTNTPMTLLIDIRQAIGDQTEVLRKNQELMIYQMEEAKRMHTEAIAYMQEMSTLLRQPPMSAVGPMQQLSLGPSGQGTINTMDNGNKKWYHVGTEVDNSNKMMACLLIQLERIASRNMGSRQGSTLDTKAMELKDWVSVIKAVAKAESTVTDREGKLTIPKITSSEGQHVMNIVASPTPGRHVMCKPEHFNDITTNCPGITGCLEEIRIRILKCPGVIGRQRAKALASIPYPYIDENQDIIQNEVTNKEIGNTIVIGKVDKLNVPQTDIYVSQILKYNQRPMIAVETATEYSTKRTTL
jgi:hypothetical protein